MKRYLFFLVILFLILPMVQGFTNLFWEPTLDGYVPVTPFSALTKESWLEGHYQDSADKHFNEGFGFRSLSIRMRNQIDFSLYGKIHAREVVMGKNNYFFERAYIRISYGTDFLGEDKVRERMEKFRFVKDTLAKLNKTVILVVSASKGFYYPEYFPDSFNVILKKKRTNVEAYTDYAKQFKIPYIDFNRYFVEQKTKYGHLLYPQHGIHWSLFGADLAADSLIRYVEKTRSIDMPNIYWKDSETRYSHEEDTDYDIAAGMNLLFRFPSKKMAYHKIHFELDSGKIKPSLLVIGDSFYWPMYNMGITNVFSDAQFWYYNKEAYPGSASMDYVNLKEELDRRDVIVIMANPATIKGCGWGFIENAYDVYANGGKEYAKFKKKVEESRTLIKSDERRRTDALAKAKEKNISLDSSITLEAVYLVKTAMKNEKDKIK